MQTQEKLRTIIITGANKGIGYTIIDKLLGQNKTFDIILTARNPKFGQAALEKLLKQHKNTSSQLTFHQLDVSDSSSIDNFLNWVQKERKGKIDVLINNAGVNTEDTTQEKLDLIRINLTGTIELTEKALPFLASDGKIIMLSSENGQLSWQKPIIRKMLEDSTIDKEKFTKIVDDLIEKTKANKHTDLGWSYSPYNNTKALLNAYTRWVLVSLVKGDQQCYTVDPCWCQTDMGTSAAPYPIEKGAETPIYLIDLPFKYDEKYNGKFFRSSKLHDF